MSDMWLSLLPIAIAMAVVPGRFLALILLLHSPKAVLTALAFVGGMASTMLIQGAAFALLFSLTGAFSGGEAGGPPVILSVLFLVVGILMLVGGLKQWLQGEDEDKPPPKWLDEIESFTPGKAFKLGLGWLFVSPKQWIFTLTAVAVIFAANLSLAASLINYLLFILIVLSLFLVLIAIYVVFPKRSAALLDGLFGWLKKNARAVLIAMFLLFGLFFFVKGLQGLLA